MPKTFHALPDQMDSFQNQNAQGTPFEEQEQIQRRFSMKTKTTKWKMKSLEVEDGCDHHHDDVQRDPQDPIEETPRLQT